MAITSLAGDKFGPKLGLPVCTLAVYGRIEHHAFLRGFNPHQRVPIIFVQILLLDTRPKRVGLVLKIIDGESMSYSTQ